MLDACGEAPSPDFQGTSLLPLIDGTCRTVRDYIFTEDSTFPNNVMRAVRSERFKLIRNYNRGKRTLAAAGLGGRTEIDTGDFYFEDWPEHEFYDLETDPHELTNLSGSEEHGEEEAELREQLDRWLAETEDPVLSNSICRPEERRIFESQPRPSVNLEHMNLLLERLIALPQRFTDLLHRSFNPFVDRENPAIWLKLSRYAALTPPYIVIY